MNQFQSLLNSIMQEDVGVGDRLLDMSLWDWSQAVALHAMMKYYQKSKDKAVLTWLEQWYDEKLPTLPEKENVNTMGQYLVLTYLYEETHKALYLERCCKAADWLLKELPRTQMGGFQHVTLDSDNHQQLWADTIYIAALFLAKLGSVTKRKEYTEESKRQFLLHIYYLSDRKTGLWSHGWSFERLDNFAQAHWARGNSWFTIAASEALELFEEDDAVTKWIRDFFCFHSKTLIELQDSCGLWHTLLDDPTSYVEVSGSCGILYGLRKGWRAGILPSSYGESIEKGIAAAKQYIQEDGIVSQVSYGTIVSTSLDYYRNVALRPSGYGQALMLLLLTEE